MSIGWQEILALGVVGLALWIIARRFRGAGPGEGGCGGANSCQSGSADRGVRIRELLDVRVAPPRNDAAPRKQPPEADD